MSSESTETIGVYVRVRGGSSDSTGKCVRVSSTTGEITALRAPKPGEASAEAVHSFRFDQVGDAGTDQASIFEAVGRPIADAALAGFNATVFAFGQTGAGKTFTMFGAEHGAERGLAPRMLERLLARVEHGRCRITAVEIHNESLSDLLAQKQPAAEREPLLPQSPHQRQLHAGASPMHAGGVQMHAGGGQMHGAPLRLREDASRGVYVANVTSIELESAAQLAVSHREPPLACRPWSAYWSAPWPATWLAPWSAPWSVPLVCSLGLPLSVPRACAETARLIAYCPLLRRLPIASPIADGFANCPLLRQSPIASSIADCFANCPLLRQ